MPKKPPTKMQGFRLPLELANWARKYAAQNNTTVTRLIVDHLTSLRKSVESNHVDQI